MSIPADVREFVTANGLTRKSSWRAGGHTAVVIASYAMTTAVGFVLDTAWSWALVFLAQGFILVGSYSAMHEAAHGTLFRSRLANRLACSFWASTILVNASMWRAFHLEHHAHTGDDEDPENRYKVQINTPWHYLLFPLGGLQFVVQLIVESFGILVGRFPSYVRGGANRRAMRVDAVVHLGVVVLAVVALVQAPVLVLHLWGGAFLVAMAGLLPMTAINEHYGCETTGTAFATTRTVVSNRLFRFLVWNTNFHVEHHLIANVTYFNTPRLHEYVRPRLQYVAPSYTSFHRDVVRSCGVSPTPVGSPT